MTRITYLLTTLLALTHTTSAEPRPPPGRPDREQSNPCFVDEQDTVGGNSDESLPPCVRQLKIAEACGIQGGDSNLTSSEMKQCLCDGSFFQDTIGCGACQNYQSLISEDDYQDGVDKVSSASSLYCDSSQTADFSSIIESLRVTRTGTESPTGRYQSGSGRDSLTTTKPTAVSNYFTATADQLGPGIESLVTDRTLTGQAPTAEPTDDDGAAVALGRQGPLESLCLFIAVAALLVM